VHLCHGPKGVGILDGCGDDKVLNSKAIRGIF
jgi:hypothetical protein